MNTKGNENDNYDYNPEIDQAPEFCPECGGPVVVEQELVNECGSAYGRRYLLFAKTRQDADRWIREHLDGPDGEYWHNQDMWNQTRVSVVTYFDDQGNASHAPWWDVLEMFAKKEIGPSALKQIARLSQWWPPESKDE